MVKLQMDRAQISIFRQTHQVRFASLLQRADGGTLEPQVGFEILGDLPHQPLERQFPDQKLSGFLVTTDFSKRQQSPACSDEVFFTLPVEGALFLAALVASSLRGAFPPVDLTSSLLGSGHFLLPNAEVLGRFSDHRAAAAAERAAVAETREKLPPTNDQTALPIFSTYIYQVPSMLGTMKNTKLIKAMVVTFVGIKF